MRNLSPNILILDAWTVPVVQKTMCHSFSVIPKWIQRNPKDRMSQGSLGRVHGLGCLWWGSAWNTMFIPATRRSCEVLCLREGSACLSPYCYCSDLYGTFFFPPRSRVWSQHCCPPARWSSHHRELPAEALQDVNSQRRSTLGFASEEFCPLSVKWNFIHVLVKLKTHHFLLPAGSFVLSVL